MLASPVDYDAVRLALVAAVRQSTGLGQNAVVMMEPEEPVANRPQVPFAALKITSPSIKTGIDACAHAGLTGDQIGVFTYSGPRTLICAFDFYGSSHEQAYSMASALQAGFDQEPVWSSLDGQGLSVLRVDQVVDLSAMLQTGFEGRAHITVQFGLTAVSSMDLGFIENVPVQGSVVGDAGTNLIVAFNADLSGD